MRIIILRTTAILLALALLVACAAAPLMTDPGDHPDSEKPSEPVSDPVDPAPVSEYPAAEPAAASEPSHSDVPVSPTPPPAPREAGVVPSDEPSERIFSDESIPQSAQAPEKTPPSQRICNTPEDRYASLTLSENDLELLARLVCLSNAEANPIKRAASPSGSRVKPRPVGPLPEHRGRSALSDRAVYPGRAAFTDDAYGKQYEAVAEAVDGRNVCVLGPDVMFFSGAPYNDQVYAVIGNHTFCEL